MVAEWHVVRLLLLLLLLPLLLLLLLLLLPMCQSLRLLVAAAEQLKDTCLSWAC